MITRSQYSIYRIALQDPDTQPGSAKSHLAKKMFLALADERVDENLEGKSYKSGISMIYRLERGEGDQLPYPKCCPKRRDTGQTRFINIV